MPLRSRATINYSQLTRYSRQYSAGRQAIHIHVRNRPGIQLTSSRPTALQPTTYATYPQRQTPRATSKGGHFNSTGHANTDHTNHHSRRTHCTTHRISLISHGPDTYKGAQNNEHSACRQTQTFTNREYGQRHHPSPSGPVQVSKQVSSKSSHARP